MEQNVMKQNEQKKDLDFNYEEGDNLRIEDRDVSNPYEMGNDNNNNKMDDNGSNIKKTKEEEDDWDF